MNVMKLTPIGELLDETVRRLMPGAPAPKRNPSVTDCASLEASARWNLRAEHMVQLIRLLETGFIAARSQFSRAPIRPDDLMPNGLPPRDFEKYALSTADVEKFFEHLAIDPTPDSDAEKASDEDDDPTPDSDAEKASDDWIRQAQSEARAYIEAQRAQDLYPNQLAIAYKVSNTLRDRGVFGTGGKPLTGETIKRHALKGITAGKPAPRGKRGKRGK